MTTEMDAATPPARPIYLDYASTTPVHPAVLQAMEPYLRQEFGNPSNLYRPGRRAAEGVKARVCRHNA